MGGTCAPIQIQKHALCFKKTNVRSRDAGRQKKKGNRCAILGPMLGSLMRAVRFPKKGPS